MYFNSQVMPPKRKPLEGKRFGKLTIGRYRGQQVYVATCDCGNVIDITRTALMRKDRKVEPQCPDCQKAANRVLREEKNGKRT